MSSRYINLSDKERALITEACPSLAKKMNPKKIKVSSAKGKGRGLQYWVCEQISRITGIPYKQSDDNCLIHSREMGQHGVDIVLRGKVFEMFPFSIECKNSEQLNLVETVNQAIANNKESTDWLIVHRRKAIPEEIVIMSWNAFERLVKNTVG